MKATNKFESDSTTQPNHKSSRGRGTRMLNLIGAALSNLYGRHFTYEEIANIAGQSTTAIFDWMLGANLRQMEALIRLLEHLPPANRAELMDRMLRQLPTIYHERIAWRERQLSNCQQLLRLESGLTWVLGEENVCDFIITALAHSATRLDSPPTIVCGIDARLPDRFVPVNGITYLGAGLHPEKLPMAADAAWTIIRDVKSGFVFLNGVWLAMRETQDEVRNLASRCHVVVADQVNLANAKGVISAPDSARLILAKEEQGGRININFANRF